MTKEFHIDIWRFCVLEVIKTLQLVLECSSLKISLENHAYEREGKTTLDFEPTCDAILAFQPLIKTKNVHCQTCAIIGIERKML